MRELKQSTAVTVVLGPFLDETDGRTAETALTISQADVRLSKNGGAAAQVNDATAAAHDEGGRYRKALSATDTDTLGHLRIDVAEAGALPVWEDFNVVSASYFDAKYGATPLPVNVAQISGDATAADNLEAAADGTGFNLGGGAVVVASVTGAVGSVGANGITAASLAADVTTELQSGLATASALTSVATSIADLPTNAELATALASADDAVLSAISTLSGGVADLPTNAELSTALAASDDAVLAAVATVDANVDAIKAQTDLLGFTAGSVDANITHVIGDAVQENSTTETNWGA